MKGNGMGRDMLDSLECLCPQYVCIEIELWVREPPGHNNDLIDVTESFGDNFTCVDR